MSEQISDKAIGTKGCAVQDQGLRPEAVRHGWTRRVHAAAAALHGAGAGGDR